jgi:hypothetical protein
LTVSIICFGEELDDVAEVTAFVCFGTSNEGKKGVSFTHDGGIDHLRRRVMQRIHDLVPDASVVAPGSP